MKVYKAIYWLTIQSRWLQGWSAFYRFLFQRKYKKSVTMTQISSPDELQAKLDKIKYSKDTYKQLFDVVHSPYYCKYVLDMAMNDAHLEGSFDCDDYACLAANLLDWHFNPQLLGISYKNRNKKFKFSGHMVCFFETPFGFRHMGNWGLSGIFKTIESMAKDIAERAESDLIGYTVFDKNLKIVKVTI